MLPHILIDWNSTIQNQKAGIIAHVKQAYNYNLIDSDFAEWDIDLSPQIGISRDDWLSVWADEEIFKNAPPYPGAKEALTRLATRYRIVILTSAACGPELCRWWFKQNRIPFSEIIWTKNKCHFGGLLIDDSPAVLAARYEQQLMTMAYSQRWNKGFDKFPRLNGWEQLV